SLSEPDVVDGAHSAASKCHRVVGSKRNHIEGNRPWARLARSGSILRSRCFRFTASMLMARWSSGGVLVEREFLSSLPICRLGMEACATAHQWARELKKLGHDTRLMPPTYVKAYVKRGKNDAADAAAICEAVTRPSMRFVPIKNVEQQGALMRPRTRDLLRRQRTRWEEESKG